MSFLLGATAALLIVFAHFVWGRFLWRWLFTINDRANARRTMKGNA